MTDNQTARQNSSLSWDTYWQGAQFSHAFSDSGVSHPEIQKYWQAVFRKHAKAYDSSKIIDIASGNGALLEIARQENNKDGTEITCVDISSAAIDSINTRFPEVKGYVANALNIPETDNRFNLVTSQFGIEYAGLAAIPEASRLVAEGGQLVLMLHIEGGSIQQECNTNLQSIEQLQKSRFIENASQMFLHGFEAVRGADRKSYDDAALLLSNSLPIVEDILTKYGVEVAGGTIAKLYNDVADIHGRLQHYNPDDVLNWLARLDDELEAYAGRMNSMISAAIGAQSFSKICFTLKEHDLEIEQNEPLSAHGKDLPLAWVVSAYKPTQHK